MDFPDLEGGQLAAFKGFVAMVAAAAPPVMLMTGPGGAGKTRVISEIISWYQAVLDANGMTDATICVAAPTHKARKVIESELAERGLAIDPAVSWQTAKFARLPTVTVAKLLGVTGALSFDDENADADAVETFQTAKATTGTLIGQFRNLKLLIIDEASMLSNDQYEVLLKFCVESDVKLLLVGDRKQLPPVNAEPLPYDALAPVTYPLTKIYRTSQPALLALQAAVRNDEDWQAIPTGDGYAKAADITSAFLRGLKAPDLDAHARRVFVAYTNAEVDAAQQEACWQVYGHDADVVNAGQVVTSAENIYAYRDTGMQDSETGRRIYANTILCSTSQDILLAEDCGEGRFGGRIYKAVAGEETFYREYLRPSLRDDPSGAYMQALTRAYAYAREQQEAVVKLKAAAKKEDARRKAGERDYRWISAAQIAAANDRRSKAWSAYYGLKERTLLNVTHPFAITAHKSQGSSFKEVFCTGESLMRYEPSAFYVAVTRPRELLVMPA